MKLRGAFNPKYQMAVGAVAVLVALLVVRATSELTATEQWARTDLRVIPWALLAGLLVGTVVGEYRLRAVRKVLKDIDGQFFASQRGTLTKLREGEHALTLQRLGISVAVLVWLAGAAYTDARIVLNASMCVYISGQIVTGQTLPFVRLWLELRKGPPIAPAR